MTGVAMLGFNPFVLVVHPSFEARTLQELLALARARPATVNYGSGGVASAPHMVVELLQLNTGIKLVHAPYRDEAPAVADVLAGQIALTFNNVAVVAGHVKSGALRALAVTSPKRLEVLPDVPTMAEAGVPDIEVETWFALTAPKATPRDIVCRLNAEVVKALAMPDLVKRHDELAIRPAARYRRCHDQVGSGSLERGHPKSRHQVADAPGEERQNENAMIGQIIRGW